MWLGERRGHVFDWVTQRWVQLTGRRHQIRDVPWLAGPTGEVRGIGADFFERWGATQGLTVLPPDPTAGLLPGLSTLAGPRFDPSAVDAAVEAFYSQTARFDLHIQTRWSGLFRLGGWLIGRLFARRLAQLNMPLSDRALQGGVHSRIVRLANGDGEVQHTAWVRTAARTEQPVFVGQYGTATIPGHDGSCIKVVFPLPNGNAVILLRPQAHGRGLSLLSDGRRFGDPGFYFTVNAGEGDLWVRYVRSMKERLDVQPGLGGLAAEHRFRVFGLPFMQLHYRIVPKDAVSETVLA